MGQIDQEILPQPREFTKGSNVPIVRPEKC